MNPALIPGRQRLYAEERAAGRGIDRPRPQRPPVERFRLKSEPTAWWTLAGRTDAAMVGLTGPMCMRSYQSVPRDVFERDWEAVPNG